MSTQTDTQTQSEASQTDTAQVDTPQTEPPQAETGPPTPQNSAQTLRFTREGEIGILTLDRPAKRNALDDQTISGLGEFFAHPPAAIGRASCREGASRT